MTISFLSRALPAILLTALVSCGNNNTGQQGNTTASPNDTATHMVNTTDRGRPQRGNDDALKNAREKIVGEWADESDLLSVLVFTTGKQISIYDGKSIDTIAYTISGTSCAGGETQAASGGLYLQTDQCYAIDNVDDATLTLIYPDRGSTLVYKRKK